MSKTETKDVTVIDGVAVPATLSDLSAADREALAIASGQGVEYGSSLPRLSTNYAADWVENEEDEDEEAKPLKRGWFKLTIPQGGDEKVTIYSKTATFHPYIKVNAYAVYNNDEKRYDLMSTRFGNWNEVVLDDIGNEFVAKKYGKAVKTAYPQWQKLLKCWNICYGTVTFDAKAEDKYGKKAKDKVVSIPCSWVTKGASFMPFAEAIDGLTKQGKMMQEHTLKINTTRVTDEDITYFPLVAEWNKKTVPFGAEEMGLYKDLRDTIDEENKQVVKRHKEVLSKRSEKDDGFVDDFSGADLSSDFGPNNDLPEALAAG